MEASFTNFTDLSLSKDTSLSLLSLLILAWIFMNFPEFSSYISSSSSPVSLAPGGLILGSLGSSSSSPSLSGAISYKLRAYYNYALIESGISGLIYSEVSLKYKIASLKGLGFLELLVVSTNLLTLFSFKSKSISLVAVIGVYIIILSSPSLQGGVESDPLYKK